MIGLMTDEFDLYRGIIQLHNNSIIVGETLLSSLV